MNTEDIDPGVDGGELNDEHQTVRTNTGRRSRPGPLAGSSPVIPMGSPTGSMDGSPVEGGMMISGGRKRVGSLRVEEGKDLDRVPAASASADAGLGLEISPGRKGDGRGGSGVEARKGNEIGSGDAADMGVKGQNKNKRLRMQKSSADLREMAKQGRLEGSSNTATSIPSPLPAFNTAGMEKKAPNRAETPTQVSMHGGSVAGDREYNLHGIEVEIIHSPTSPISAEIKRQHARGDSADSLNGIEMIIAVTTGRHDEQDTKTTEQVQGEEEYHVRGGVEQLQARAEEITGSETRSSYPQDLGENPSAGITVAETSTAQMQVGDANLDHTSAEGKAKDEVWIETSNTTRRTVQGSRSTPAISSLINEHDNMVSSQSVPSSLGKATGNTKASSLASIIDSLKQKYVTHIHAAFIPIGHSSNQAERQVVYHRTASENGIKKRSSSMVVDLNENSPAKSSGGLRRSESLSSGLSDFFSPELLSGSFKTSTSDGENGLLLTPYFDSAAADIPYWLKTLPASNSYDRHGSTRSAHESNPALRRTKSPGKLTGWDDDVDDDVRQAAASTWVGYDDGYDGSVAMLYGRSPKSSWSEELSNIAATNARRLENDSKQVSKDVLNELAREVRIDDNNEYCQEQQDSLSVETGSDVFDHEYESRSQRGKVGHGDFEHVEYSSSNGSCPGSPEDDLQSIWEDYESDENDENASPPRRIDMNSVSILLDHDNYLSDGLHH